MSEILDRIRARAAARGSNPNASITYDNFTYSDRLNNVQYLTDIRRFARERGWENMTDAEIDEQLHDSANYRDLNTLGSFFGASGSSADLAKYSKSEDSLRGAARIMQALDMAPYPWQEGGRGMRAVPSIAGAIATDPVNWALGAVEAGTFGAATPFVAGARTALGGGRAVLAGTRAGAMQGLKIGAAEGAITGALSDVGRQGLEQDLGISEDFSFARLAESTALSTVLSGAVGGVAGGGGGAIGGARGAGAVDGLRRSGYTDAEIEQVMPNGVAGINQLRSTTPDDLRAQVAAEELAAAANGQQPPSPLEIARRNADQNREIRLGSQMQALQGYLNELHEKLRALTADNEVDANGVGILDDQIEETRNLMANVKEAMLFPEGLKRRQAVIDQLLVDPSPEKRAQGRQLQKELYREQSEFDSIVGSDVPEDIAAFIDRRLQNTQALDAGRNINNQNDALAEAAQKAALKERQKIMANEGRTLAQAEGIQGKETGAVPERVDDAMGDQARLEDVQSADADGIIKEAEEMARQQADAEAAAAAGATPDATAAQQQPAAQPEAAPQGKGKKGAAAQQPQQAPAPEQQGTTVGQAAHDKAIKLDSQAAQQSTPPKTPVTPSTAGSASINASKAAKQRAISLGIDLADVKGTGKDGRILGSDIDKHVEESGASETFSASADFISDALEAALDRILAKGTSPKAAAKMLGDPNVVRRAIMEFGGDALDDDSVASLMDVFEVMRKGASDEDNPVTFQAPNFQSKTEKRFFAKRVAELVTSGHSESAANLIAAMDVARRRRDPGPVKVDKTKVEGRMVGASRPTSTTGRMDLASPIQVNEKGNPVYRLQSLLREGRKFTDADGGEYSITTQVPHRSTFKYDAAAAQARAAYDRQQKLAKKKRLTASELKEAGVKTERYADQDKTPKEVMEAGNILAVQPFVANGRTRAKDSPETPPKGTILYVSGATGKAFVDWRRAFGDVGQALGPDAQQPEQLAALVANLRAKQSPGKTSSSTAKRNKNVAISLETKDVSSITGDKSLNFDDFISAYMEVTGLREIDVSEAGTPATTMPPLSKGGKRAFFINNKTGEVRSPNDKQITDGLTAKSVLGKSDPADWTVEYHDMSVPRSKSGLEQARGQTISNFKKQAIKTVAPKKADDFKKEVVSSKADPAVQAAVDQLNKSLAALNDPQGLPRSMKYLALKPNFTGQELDRVATILHRLPFSSTNEHSVAALRAVAELEAIIAPNGIRPPAATRAEAIDSINTIFAKLPEDIVQPMRDLVERLANGEAPRLATSSTPKIPVASYDPNEGTIYFERVFADGKATTKAPLSHVFFHEVGHWGYFNLLTAKDRAEFWDWASKNIRTGDRAAEMLGASGTPWAKHYDNPTEAFAEAFAQWATGKIDSASNPAMWQRFARYVKALFDLIVAKKPVDRDLEKLFLKILPDEQAQRLAEDLDAIEAGATPIEVELAGVPDVEGAIDDAAADLEAGQSAAQAGQPISLDEPVVPPAPDYASMPLPDGRPDYMALSIDDLLEVGDESRVPFIKALKDVHTQVQRIRQRWTDAVDTLDPDVAIEAYQETASLLIGRILDMRERARYLSSVARATKTTRQPIYSKTANAFGPFALSPFQILNRGKKLLRRLNRARSGWHDRDIQPEVLMSVDVDEMAVSEAVEAGLTSSNKHKALAALLDVVTSPGDGEVDGSLLRLLDDMETSLNDAFEQSGIIPKRELGLSDTEVEVLKTIQLGRFEIGVGDVFIRQKKYNPNVPKEERGKRWTVKQIEENSVIMVDDEGNLGRATAASMDTFNRYKSATGKEEIEAGRAARLQKRRELRGTVKKKRVELARKMAHAKLSAMPEPTLPASPTSVSAKALPEDKLLARVSSNTEVAPQAADEAVSRELAKPVAIDGVASSPLDEARANVAKIRDKILAGDESVDSDVAALAATRPDEVSIAPRDNAVNKAIRRELAEGVGVSTEAGVPASASPDVKDLLLNIKHRDRRTEYTARTLAYRLIMLATEEGEDLTTNPFFGDGLEVGRGFQKETVPDTGWLDMRARIKRLASQLTGDAPANATIKELSDLITLFDNGVVQFSGLGLDDAADALRAMLNPNSGIDIPAGAKQAASALLDRAAYLTNGLIQAEGLRKPLARLTYYNDMFARRGDPVSAEAAPLSNMTMTEALSFSATMLTPETFGLDPAVLSRAGFNDIAMVSGSGEIVTSPLSSSFGKMVEAQLDPTGDDYKRIMAIGQRADRLRSALASASDPAKRRKVMTALADHIGMLEEEGIPIPRFSIMAVRARSPFKRSSILDKQASINGLRASLEEAMEEGAIPAAWHDHVNAVMNRLRPRQTTGEFYDALAEGKGVDPDAVLQALGYDSIMDRYGKVQKVFSADQTANIEDFLDPNLFSAPAAFIEDAPLSMGAALSDAALATAREADRYFAAPAAWRVASGADDHGIRNFLLNFGRNRALKRSDDLAPIRMKYKWFGTNARRLRSGGFNTVADFFENHFPSVQQDFMRRLSGTKEAPGPLRAIRALPDAPSWKRRYLANSVGKTPKPDSYKRILNALWEPGNPKRLAALSDQEKTALKSIRTAMTQVYNDLTGAGVMMGSRGKDFFPQIWSQVAIRKDPTGAIDAFTEYFRIEASKAGRTADETSARAKAQNIVAKLAEVDNETIWDPDTAKVVAGAADHIDYSRKIELDKHPEALEALKPYLEQDLEAYLVKYFDQAAHRVSLAKKFGHRNHGFGDYMTVTVKGRDGIAELLSTRRTQEHNTFAFTPEDGLVDLNVSESFPMPFEGREFEAIQAAQETIDIFGSLGAEAARRHLISLAVPDPRRGGGPSVVYERRVNAIVDSLRDFGGQQKRITTTDEAFMTNVMKLAARRPLIDSNTVGIGAAKSLKAFNSITLLSYTLLASMGDSILPVVRSGDMVSAMKGWASYMRDPDYRDAMRSVGASIESLLHNRLVYMTGTPASRISSAFFNATGLTPWTDEMRSIATAVGFEALKTAQKKANRAYQKGVPIAQQSAEFKRNYRMLSRYGLQRFATDPTFIGSKAIMESDELRTGLMKFVDDAVFSPNPNDIPVWAQTPWGSVLFQLKSFPLMMQRMAKEVLWDDVKLAANEMLGRPVDMSGKSGTGNLKRGMYFMSMLPLVGYGVNTAMDVVRGRGGEEGTERKPAERSFSQILRQFPYFDEDFQASFGILENIADRETLDAFVGQYLSGLSTAAGLGLFSSMLTDAAQQTENGAYGTQRIASAVFGPSMGTFISGVNVVQGVVDSNDRSAYPERQAAREIFQRIPILGGQRGLRESFVDSLPIDQQAKRRARVGGGFGGGGFEGGF